MRTTSAAKAGKLLCAHKREKLTHAMMGGKLPSSQSGEDPSSHLKFFSNSVSMARLHAAAALNQTSFTPSDDLAH